MLRVIEGSFGTEGTITLNEGDSSINVVSNKTASYKAEHVFQIKTNPIEKLAFHFPTFALFFAISACVLAGGLWFAMGPDGALVGFVAGLIIAIIKRNKKTLFYSTKITFGDGNHVVVEHDRGEMRPFIRLTEDANTE
jgi:hypothetical protein